MAEEKRMEPELYVSPKTNRGGGCRAKCSWHQYCAKENERKQVKNEDYDTRRPCYHEKDLDRGLCSEGTVLTRCACLKDFGYSGKQIQVTHVQVTVEGQTYEKYYDSSSEKDKDGKILCHIFKA